MHHIRFWDTSRGPTALSLVDKAIYGAAQAVLSALLREAREAAGLRQVDVAQRLDVAQSFVSKYESGERRLDLIELRQICQVLEVPLQQVVAQLEARL